LFVNKARSQFRSPTFTLSLLRSLAFSLLHSAVTHLLLRPVYKKPSFNAQLLPRTVTITTFQIFPHSDNNFNI